MYDTIVVRRSTLVELIEIARQVKAQGLPMTDAQEQALRDAAIPMMAPRYGEDVDNLLERINGGTRQLAFDFGAEFDEAERALAERQLSEKAERFANAKTFESTDIEGPHCEQLQFDFGG